MSAQGSFLPTELRGNSAYSDGFPDYLVQGNLKGPSRSHGPALHRQKKPEQSEMCLRDYVTEIPPSLRQVSDAQDGPHYLMGSLRPKALGNLPTLLHWMAQSPQPDQKKSFPQAHLTCTKAPTFFASSLCPSRWGWLLKALKQLPECLEETLPGR